MLPLKKGRPENYMPRMQERRLAAGHGQHDTRSHPRPGGSAGREAPRTSRRVLIVEDNLDTLRSTTLLLRDMGHEVDYAINGYAALEAARRFKPEIIILDLGLPGMDGFELCRKLRAEGALKSVRVIACTGYGQEEYRVRSREAGCEVHLVKPVDPRVLQDLIEQGGTTH